MRAGAGAKAQRQGNARASLDRNTPALSMQEGHMGIPETGV